MRSIAPGDQADLVDWSDYARVYDLIVEYNPAYQDIVRHFETTVANWTLGAGDRVLDFAAGTGNFGLRLARAFPGVEVILFDRDPEMLGLARAKAARSGVQNVEFIEGDGTRLARYFPPAAFRAVVAVHCLYTLPRPATLRAVARSVAPGGYAYLCDLGRPMDTGDGGRFLAKSMIRRHGLLHTARIFWRGRRIGRENRRIREMQLNGAYWTHGPEEFRVAVDEAGFDILKQEAIFRGYSDVADARRRA